MKQRNINFIVIINSRPYSKDFYISYTLVVRFNLLAFVECILIHNLITIQFTKNNNNNVECTQNPHHLFYQFKERQKSTKPLDRIGSEHEI